MKLSRILAVLLALALALGCAVTAFAAGDFTDVSDDAYYAAAVQWAVEKGITDGMGNNEFRPDYTVNRAQAVTFLWRMAGQPEPTQTETFADVEADANNWWYKTAVQWAVEKGITNGTNKGFEPYLTCSRGMILTMLYRLEGEPWNDYVDVEIPENEDDWTLDTLFAATIQFFVELFRSEDGLSDVPQGAWYELPVYWAVANGILNENHYSSEDLAIHPTADCPRGDMVYFLYMDSGDAPNPYASATVQTGTIPETVLLDDAGVKITLNGTGSDEYGDPLLNMTLENGSDKTLRADVCESWLNTYNTYLQAYVPVESEDGVTFYGDAVAAPGETKDFYVSLSSAAELGFDAIYELELQMAVIEVEWDAENEYYDWVDQYAAGEKTELKTSLYDPAVAYDKDGELLLASDGLEICLLGTEVDDFWGPKVKLYAYNGGSEDVIVEVAEMKLDGVVFDCLFSMDLPAGKRDLSEAYAFFMGDEVPTGKTVELTFQLVDRETWEAIKTLEPVTVTIPD